MYIISQGTCSVTVHDKDFISGKMKEILVRMLEKNSYFGEISLVHDSVRTATVTCSNYSTLG